MIKFNEVTWYSKLAAIIFFIGVLPVLTFYIGTKYEEAKIANNSVSQEQYSAVNKTPTQNIPAMKQPNDCSSFEQSPKIETGDLVSLPIECVFNIGNGFSGWNFKINQINESAAELEISNGENIIQKIDIKNYQSESPSQTAKLSIGDAQFNIANDYNFDGFKDIRVTSEIAASNIFFDYWMFNPKTGKFEKDSVLTNVGNPEFKNKKITASIAKGANDTTVSTYEFSNGKYVKTNE